MKNLLLFAFLFIGMAFSAVAQFPAKYWVQFKDKNHSDYSVNRPEDFLSPRAIENRQRWNIAIDETDIPVSQYYINKLMEVDSSIVVITRSKWLNGVTLYSEREDAIALFSSLPFVNECVKTALMKNVLSVEDSVGNYCDDIYQFGLPEQNNVITGNDLDYGQAEAQIRTNNAHWLHRMGYKGRGVHLTVMDGGFIHADSLRFYAVLRDEHRLLGTRNFVQPGGCVFTDDAHGEMVLSCIASYVPGEIIGSAPMVSVYLAKTEDGRTEYVIEEDNWAAGCEWADSLGCEVLSASLGYFIFDDSSMVRHYSDLNGKVSRASRVATMAVKKGLIVVNSAGNAGMRKDWSKIGFPTEAYDVLSVGAIDVNGKRAPFSSKGPAVGGRIKPDVCAVGAKTVIGRTSGVVGVSNGTSFSAPLMAGMVACLRQAFPDKSSYEVMNAVRKSGSQYLTPDTLMGYGVADMLKAYNYLLNDDEKVSVPDENLYCVQFPSFVYEYQWGTEKASKKQAGLPMIVNNPNGKYKNIEVEMLDRSTSQLSCNTYRLKSGKNTISLKMPSVKDNTQYMLLDVKVSTSSESSNFVIGMEHSLK